MELNVEQILNKDQQMQNKTTTIKYHQKITNIEINGEIIQQVNQFQYPGVIVEAY